MQLALSLVADTPGRAGLMVMKILELDIWGSERTGVLAELEPFAAAGEERKSRHVTHPVDDFLFDYYSLRPSRLRRYSPGPNVLLREATLADVDPPRHFVVCNQGMSLKPFPQS